MRDYKGNRNPVRVGKTNQKQSNMEVAISFKIGSWKFTFKVQKYKKRN